MKENDKNESWDRTDLMGLYAKSSSFMQQIIAALETVKHRIINADKSHRANRLNANPLKQVLFTDVKLLLIILTYAPYRNHCFIKKSQFVLNGDLGGLEGLWRFWIYFGFDLDLDLMLDLDLDEPWVAPMAMHI